MPQSRHLAAIMFTDIVGYTLLMGRDEQEAFKLLEKNRQLQKTLIKNYNGTWIKELGDGVLATFTSVTDSVNCAVAIIKGCSAIDGLNLRIGINQAEVVVENNDVFGDGVNIASRLMTQAPIGGICISDNVRSNLANNKGISIRFLREEKLKHVTEPVRLYEVVVENSTDSKSPSKIAVQTELTARKSIAVLPFVNMSNDPEQEYFSDGMAEEILNSLSNLKDLKVAARTSSFQFKGKNIDLREIGEKLGVGNILEGSVRKQGNRLRVTAQLINVIDGFHLWSEKFDREMDDIFAIQDEIALKITEKLKVILLKEERATIIKIPTESKEAYDLYLKGRFYLNQRGIYFKKSLEYFQQSIGIDPSFALPYAAIAEVYSVLVLYVIIPPNVGIPKARQAAEQAIKLDPTLVDPYVSLAFIKFAYDWDWTEAKETFEYAARINSNYGLLHNWYSMYLGYVEQDYQKSLSAAIHGAKLEPYFPAMNTEVAAIHYAFGNFSEAIRTADDALNLEPNYYLAHWYKGMAYLGLEKYENAITTLQTALSLSARNPLPLWTLGVTYYQLNDTGKVNEIYAELLHRMSSEYIAGFALSHLAFLLGKSDEAIKFLDLAFDQKDWTLVTWKTLPCFENIRAAPMYQKYLERLNFPAI